MDDEESQDAAIRRTQSLRYPHSGTIQLIIIEPIVRNN